MATMLSSLVAHYKMNDNLATNVILDELGNNNGTVTDPGGTATSAFHSTTGKLNLAQNFDDTDDYIALPDGAALDFTPRTDAFSISLWAKPDGGTTGAFISKGTGAATQQYGIYMTNGPIHIQIGTTVSSVAASGIDDGNWHHIVLTVPAASTGAKLYDDNSVMTFTTGTGAIGATAYAAQAASIGVIGDSVTYWIGGDLDNVMIFSKELTEAEIKSLWNYGAGTESVPISSGLSHSGYRVSSYQKV